jgi:hypothetical protein
MPENCDKEGKGVMKEARGVLIVRTCIKSGEEGL